MNKLASRNAVDILEVLGTPIPRGKPSKRPLVRPTKWDKGNCIYLFKHVHTNQVIYSLTHWIDQNEAMKQLTFYGKKSVPSEIRKDLWRPFATVVFPFPRIVQSSGSGNSSKTLDKRKIEKLGFEKLGVLATDKLRQLRLLRDYAWREDGQRVAVSAERLNGMVKPHAVKLYNKRTHRRREEKLDMQERKEQLMDHTATSVADLATVIEHIDDFILTQLDTAGFAEDGERARRQISDQWHKLLRDFEEGNQRETITTIEKQMNEIWTKIQTNQYATNEGLQKAREQERKLRIERNELVRIQKVIDNIRASNVIPEAFDYGIERQETNTYAINQQQKKDISNGPDAQLQSKATVTNSTQEAAVENTSTPRATSSNSPEQQLMTAAQTSTLPAPFKDPELGGKWQRLMKKVIRRYDRDLRYHEEWSKEDLDRKLPIHIFWADLFDRKFINTWPSNVFHSWIGPRNNRDVYFGAIPPGDPETPLEIYDSGATVTRTVKVPLRSPDKEEVRLTNWRNDLENLLQQQTAKQLTAEEAKCAIDEQLSQLRELDPNGKTNDLLRTMRAEIKEDIALEKSSNQKSNSTKALRVKNRFLQMSDEAWQRLWPELHTQLDAQNEILINEIAGLQDSISSYKFKIQELEQQIEELVDERHEEIVREVYQGNDGIDDDIVLLESEEDDYGIATREEKTLQAQSKANNFLSEASAPEPQGIWERVRGFFPFGKPNVS